VQNPVHQDVLNVLREVSRIRAAHPPNSDVGRLRRMAVEAVAERELAEGRFKNIVSAQNSIQDACSRRLNLAQAVFDAHLERLIDGDPVPIETALRPIHSDPSYYAKIRVLFGVPPINVEDQDLTDGEIDDALRANRLRIGMVPTDSHEALTRQRRGQARIRTLTVINYRGSCAVCDVTDRDLLVASHIVRWADSPEQRGDLSNVICLCRIHDALFEIGYWSLDDGLRPLKRASVASDTIRRLLEAMTSFASPLEYSPGAAALAQHRQRVGLSP